MNAPFKLKHNAFGLDAHLDGSYGDQDLMNSKTRYYTTLNGAKIAAEREHNDNNKLNNAQDVLQWMTPAECNAVFAEDPNSSDPYANYELIGVTYAPELANANLQTRICNWSAVYAIGDRRTLKRGE